MNVLALLSRILLYPFSIIYGGLIWLRNRLYDSGFMSSVAFSVPVICVGNLSTGGTGKTPHVEYLVYLLQYQYKAATMSRGYKRRTQGFLLADENTNALKIGDEPMQYHMKFPELTVSVAEERMTGIPILLQQVHDVEVVILDDAYQHRSVKAGINILITDFSRPFFEDYILPYGRLRESRKAYQRADIVIVSKCSPSLSAEKAASFTQNINPLSHQQVFFTNIGYDTPVDIFINEPVSYAGKNVLLVCCIANPQPLIDKVKAAAADVHILTYPDHHYFLSKDMEEIKAAWDNWQVPDKLIVTTEKDAARLHLQKDTLAAWGYPVCVQPIKVQFLFGQGPVFDEIIGRYIAKTLEENSSWE